MSLVSFVIPCYRSANTIGNVIDELRRTMPTLPEYDYEIVLVNDCSPDNTFSVISSLAQEDEHITAVDLIHGRTIAVQLQIVAVIGIVKAVAVHRHDLPGHG